jgi:hypothetical protein
LSIVMTRIQYGLPKLADIFVGILLRYSTNIFDRAGT